MANQAKWVAGATALNAPTSLLTATELAPAGTGLANNTASAASAAYANNTNLDLYCDLLLDLGSLTPATGGYLNIYILCSYDGGTNYPSATGSVLRNQPQQLWCSIPLDTTAAAQRQVVRGLLMPPESFKVVLDNQSGVALANGGSTVKLIPYNVNLNG